MDIKLGKMVTYHEELPLIKLLETSLTWFCEITLHIKYFVSALALDQSPPNMVRW